ncbi:hypothetical protein FRC07_006210 [Ceratobasidium sp. 392]|nr:hypothetical protein FRC07_006210 [Ceratobasidium sp. 392]
MTGLGNHLVEPATPSPALHDSSVYVQGQGEHQGSTTSLFHGLEATALRPRWLLSGQTPNKQEVDDLVRAMKDGRRQHDGDGPPLNCPLPCCENNKELRRPQALRHTRAITTAATWPSQLIPTEIDTVVPAGTKPFCSLLALDLAFLMSHA